MTRSYTLGTLAVLAGLLPIGCRKTGTPDEPARKTALANYHQIVKAQYEYHNRYDSFAGGIAAGKGVGLSWRVAVLPYLGEDALYREFKLDEPWDSPANRPLVERMPAVFASPGNPAPHGHTFVRSTQGPGGMTPFTPATRLPDHATAGTLLRGRSLGWKTNNVTDGTSNTIMFVEAGEPVPWSKPDELPVPFSNADAADVPVQVPPLGGVFADGFHVAMVDGVVRFLKRGYPEKGLAVMLTPSGGEVWQERDHPKEFVAYSTSPPSPLPAVWEKPIR